MGMRRESPKMDLMRAAASHSRNILTGEGGDPLLAGKARFITPQTLAAAPSKMLFLGARSIIQKRMIPVDVKSFLPLAANPKRGILTEFAPVWLHPSLRNSAELKHKYASFIAQQAQRSTQQRNTMFDDAMWQRAFGWRDPGNDGDASKVF